LVDLACRSSADSQRRAIVCPRASIEIMRQTIESAAIERGRRAVILPQFLARDDWLARLHQALVDAPMLTRLERDARRRCQGGDPSRRPTSRSTSRVVGDAAAV
jgi:hypothetical protein